MISSESRGVWRELEVKLRPYIARRLPAEIEPNDVLQDVFIRLHGGEESLRDEDSFGGWVYRIAQRCIADHLRAHVKKQVTLTALPDTGGTIEPELQVAEEDLTPELAQCVAIFVARLPAPYRAAITLTELQCVTQKSAAEMLNVPLSTLKSRVSRGREKIRRMFEECCVISVDSRGRVTECVARTLCDIPNDCRAMAIEWSEKQRRRLG